MQELLANNVVSKLELPRSNTPARKRPVPSISSDFVEAVFRPVPAGKHRKLAGVHRKNPKNFRPEYCFDVPVSSGAFLQDTVIFPQDPVAGIIDLGYCKSDRVTFNWLIHWFVTRFIQFSFKNID
jgi:hypothetical protein